MKEGLKWRTEDEIRHATMREKVLHEKIERNPERKN